MKLQGGWLHVPATQKICALLAGAGHKVLFVGGCVRNQLLGIAVVDVDIATDATPEKVTSLAKSADIKAVPTGYDHGTVTLVLDHVSHEVTTFRQDITTDGRRAVVAFSTAILDDAARRDFTINALYAEPDGTLVDPLGGLADLKDSKVRFIGDADMRIREDYLRILRFFRFHAWFAKAGAGLDAEGLRACARNLDGIASLSRERIGAEMRKLLAAADPGIALAAMQQIAALDPILPGAVPAPVPALVEMERRAGVDPSWLRRLAAIGGSAAAENLRLSRTEARQLADIHAAIKATGDPARLAQRFGAEAALHATLIACAATASPPPRDLQSQIRAGAAAVFPVSAADLSATVPPGPELGRTLKRLRNAWIASGMELSREQLLTGISAAR